MTLSHFKNFGSARHANILPLARHLFISQDTVAGINWMRGADVTLAFPRSYLKPKIFHYISGLCHSALSK
jgi:hypothetical protein